MHAQGKYTARRIESRIWKAHSETRGDFALLRAGAKLAR